MINPQGPVPTAILREFNKAFGNWTYGTYMGEGVLGEFVSKVVEIV